MYDAPKVIIGLGAFVAVISGPIWYTAAANAPTARPELAKAVKGTACVKDTAYMRAWHMDLLNTWRDDVVRQGERTFKGDDGTLYDKSLSRTCLDCHADKQAFCDRCHTYASVDVTCFRCHVEPPRGEMKTAQVEGRLP
ncbi:MAG: sulfate reduction electron transfer complex DsrMKJOP subunit DsrJ [Pseudomonadota bacterium]